MSLNRRKCQRICFAILFRPEMFQNKTTRSAKDRSPFAKAQSGINFEPRFEISFCPCSVLTSSSLLLGIMVWAVGTGMAIAMLLDVQVHHLHLQLQQLLTPPLLVLRSTLFYHLAGLVRICLGPGSGDPKVAILTLMALSNFFYFFSPLFPSAAPTAAPTAATRAAQLQQRDSHWSSRF